MQQVGQETTRRWSNRTVLREIDDRHVARLGRVVLSIVVAAAPAAVYLLQHNESVKLSYEVNALQAERERLLVEERKLTLEKSRLEALSRIEAWARQRNGMVQPGDDEVVIVPSSAATDEVDLLASGSRAGSSAEFVAGPDSAGPDRTRRGGQ